MKQRQRKAGFEFDNDEVFLTTARNYIGRSNLALDFVPLALEQKLDWLIKVSLANRIAHAENDNQNWPLLTIEAIASPRSLESRPLESEFGIMDKSGTPPAQAAIHLTNTVRAFHFSGVPF